LLRLAAKYLFPLLIKYFIIRMSKKFEENINNATKQQTYTKEGETHIDYSSEKNKTKTSDIGEYVDFEDMKK